MSAPTKATTAREKKKRFQRATTKRYRWVTFTQELFGDEVFELPAIGQMSNGLINQLNQGNFSGFYAWLKDLNVDEDAVEAIQSLDSDEFMEFQKDWSDGVDLPKSSD